MARQPDILELYGYAPTDPRVRDRLATRICPFTDNECTKVERGIPTGVCAVTTPNGEPGIICPSRLLGDSLATLRLAASESFGAPRFLLGERADIARQLAADLTPAVAAFANVQLPGSKLTFDWMLQHYDYHQKRTGFIAAQIVTNEITGSYADSLEGYRDHHDGVLDIPPPSQHVISSLKKVIPEVIKRGLVCATTESCFGNYLIVTEAVMERLLPVFSVVPERAQIASDILCVRVYAPDPLTASGVRITRTMNLAIRDIASAYYSQTDEKTSDRLELFMRNIV